MTCSATILTLTHQDSTEKTLVKTGKAATEKLINALGDTGKTVIAHIILSEIWRKENEYYGVSTKYIYKNCNQLIGWHNIYNGLVWEWTEETGNTIRQSEIQKIKNYWTAKYVDKKNITMNDARVLTELMVLDYELFPCNKVYDNNSAAVKYKELYELLEKKSDHPLFKSLWNRFGNDSTVKIFDDCFFITYDPEGLSFRFEKDSILSSIFVESPYAGELPNKLKLSDRRPVVENKIGRPFKWGSYVDNTWAWYKAQSLYLDFDKNGKIIKLSISKR
ncbi:hypothetical protein [Ferruginibacter sp.]